MRVGSLCQGIGGADLALEAHGHTVAYRYAAAVERWAVLLGVEPPAPTDDKNRLAPAFVEWMMGYPAGWITDLDLTRTAQLKALGNAQQPQVAYQAWRLLTGRLESEAVAA